MEILLVLIPLSIVLIGFAAAAFIWAAREGQFENFEDAARLPSDEPIGVIPSEARDIQKDIPRRSAPRNDT